MKFGVIILFLLFFVSFSYSQIQTPEKLKTEEFHTSKIEYGVIFNMPKEENFNFYTRFDSAYFVKDSGRKEIRLKLLEEQRKLISEKVMKIHGEILMDQTLAPNKLCLKSAQIISHGNRLDICSSQYMERVKQLALDLNKFFEK